MALPTSPTNVTKTIPSYLYFQYINDPDLPSLINSYNALTQDYVDWFNNVNLPVYTQLSGDLLDWIGRGIYGVPRPNLATVSINGVVGPLASLPWVGPVGPTTPDPNIVKALATTQIYATSTTYTTTDDIYKRIITWWYYKADGTTFSIPWLKRRINRFLFGANGLDVNIPYTPDISVTFNDSTAPLPTCEINLYNVGTTIGTVSADYFVACVADGVLNLPFRFDYTVTLHT